MNLEFSQGFMDEHKAKILDLFLTYQMIETMLFMKLYLPGISETEDRGDYLEDINKKLNSKTLGKLRKEYLRKYPSDNYNLALDLEVLGTQRNSFMHSLCMTIGLCDSREKAFMLGELIVNSSYEHANSVRDKVVNLNF